ncbi:homologous-pairing protein 2 homolog [Chelonus insularis]|uniref:homologous-pairing protein 2 homolog n=1 Tax=Chelonus insularis TaxID=460826 RepID=UPI0015897028|nr:homologous-pairing protein 2 homolog [Chelonus insularis]XP_034943942.1 homologous-pairing protein 2 homolog [Chelonus insularis]XP_034943943.1 homologous-pairing protein 2 homolog [Chelonus insularis]XP_034943945.1 homologous-pairing protein 2 homolog [Chelonus insularis]
MATDVVYQFLKTRHRPYNVNDIVANLPKETDKKTIQQALDKLVKQEKVFQKLYGKQKIYCILPDTKKDARELIRIDRELQTHATELESKLATIEKEVKAKQATLVALQSAPSLEEAQKDHQERKTRIQQLEKRLDSLMQSNGSQDLSEKKKQVQKSLDLYSREYSKRKRLCTEALDSILEGYPGTKKSLYDAIGIEVKIVS